MKKGALHFRGRKNQSLFDSKVDLNKEIENAELVLDSSAITESGTAKVRARPTVKHSQASSSDPVQGFAVPTPKVPLMPPVTGPGRGQFPNGESLAGSNPLLEDLFIPPPPTTAPPPPPPPKHIPPPPDSTSKLTPPLEPSVLASLQPPSMPAPKPPLQPPDDSDFYSLKPPPMAPPKPPSDHSSAPEPKISYPSNGYPDHPTFAPPEPPPSLAQPQTSSHKGHKVPPPKPIRFSSMLSQDELPGFLAPAPPVPSPAPSSFNPQSPAKIYSIPKGTLLGGQADHEAKAKPIIFFENYPNDQSVPIQGNGKAHSAVQEAPTKASVPPAKPARRNSSGIEIEKDIQNLRVNMQSVPPNQIDKAQGSNSSANSLEEPKKPSISPSMASTEKKPAAMINPEIHHIKPSSVSPSRIITYSPYSHSPQNVGVRDVATSPMALLMAAKEREKLRAGDNGPKRTELSSMSIHPSEYNPNSFIFVSKSPSSVSGEDGSGNLSVNTEQSLQHHRSASPSNMLVEPQNLNKGKSSKRPSSDTVRDEENGEDLSIPVIPPPPEFANCTSDKEEPLKNADRPPPDPPTQRISEPPKMLAVDPAVFQTKASPPPLPPPKPKPAKVQSLPTVVDPKTEIPPKPMAQTHPKTTTPPGGSPSLSASQATLLSILQKKMLEMDHKHPLPQVDHSNDDWATLASDEESAIPYQKKQTVAATPHPTAPTQAKSLDMGELGNQAAKKAQTLSASPKSSKGPQSKQHIGMTFTVRPGTKQPITIVSKGDAP